VSAGTASETSVNVSKLERRDIVGDSNVACSIPDGVIGIFH
jgi:hypothetical protein